MSHEWLKSYLSERNQITVIDGITSSSSSISHGVVSGACFLAGGVLNCDLSHRRSMAVLCMLYSVQDPV